MKYLWAQLKANWHGLKFLFCIPPQAHHVGEEWGEEWNWKKFKVVVSHWRVFCCECGVTFGEEKRNPDEY